MNNRRIDSEDICDSSRVEPTTTVEVIQRDPRAGTTHCDLPSALPVFDTVAPNTISGERVAAVGSGLVVGNTAQLATCADTPDGGQVGDGVLEAESTHATVVDIAALGLSEAEVARVMASPEVFVAAAISDTAQTLANVYGMSVDNATVVLEAVRAARLLMNDEAYSTAKASLNCVFLSAAVSLSCEPPALVNSDSFVSSLPVSNPVDLTYGAASSFESQADADNAAMAIAQSNLRCFYASDAMTVTCEEQGFDAIPTDTDILLCGDRRIGSFSLSAGVAYSELSQEDANMVAREIGLRALNCFYVNEALTRTCPAETIVSPTVTLPDSTQSSTVNAPAGLVKSLDSTADANALATDLADAQLFCEYGNGLLELECPVQTVTDPNNPAQEIDIPADDSQEGYRVVVPPNLYRSPISIAEADALALSYASSTLVCSYCNPEILPTCVPDSVIADVLAGDLTLPLHPTAVEGEILSNNATAGVPAKLVCLSSAAAAIAQAQAVARLPIQTSTDPEDGCLYGNDAIPGIKCPIGATPLSYRDKTPEEIAASLDNGIGPNVILVTKGQVPVDFDAANPSSESRVKNYANALARQIVEATLMCVYYSDEVTVTCAIHLGKLDVHPLSVGSDIRPVVLKAGTSFSFKSKEAANNDAVELGKGKLNCFYANRKSTFRCDDNMAISRTEQPDGAYLYGSGAMRPLDGSYADPSPVHPESRGSIINPVVVKANTYQSQDSQRDADEQAEALALASMNCFWKSLGVVLYCGAGPSVEVSWTAISELVSTTVTSGTGNYNGGATVGIPGNPDEPGVWRPGVITSKISKREATTQAYDAVRASLNCMWSNMSTVATCPVLTGAGGSNGRFAENAVDVFTVGQHSIFSFESQGDADSKAFKLAQDSLDCTYTNEDIEVDAPDGTTHGGGGGTSGGHKFGEQCKPDEKAVGIKKLKANTFFGTTPDSPKTAAREFITFNQQCVKSTTPKEKRHPFEIYISTAVETGSDDYAMPLVKCAFGTICEAHTSDAGVSIDGLDDAWEPEPAQFIFLRVELNIDDGSVSSAELVRGSKWADFPEQFADVSETGNVWYHPIGQVISAIADELGSYLALNQYYGIRQLTNTHLRVGRACSTDEEMILHWKLEPGPGVYI